MNVASIVLPRLTTERELLVLGTLDVASAVALAAHGLDVVVVARDAERLADVPGVVAVPDDPVTLPLDPESTESIVLSGAAAFEAIPRARLAVRPGGLVFVLLPGEGGLSLSMPPRSWFAGWDVALDERTADGGWLVAARRPTWAYEQRSRAPAFVEPEPVGVGGLAWDRLSEPATSETYIKRPWGSGDGLARLIRQGLTPIAVYAPAGTGKTTELRRAAEVLGPSGYVLHADLPALGAAELAPSVLLWELARTLVEEWVERDLQILPTRLLIKDLRASNPRLPAGDGKARRPVEMLNLVIAELAEAAPRVVVLLDGLDTLPSDIARGHAEALTAVRGAAVVVAVGPELVHGPENQVVLEAYRLYSIPTPPSALDPERTVAFLRSLVVARLGASLPPQVDALVTRAAERSGGVPRRFLDLLVGAAGYATSVDDLGAGLDDALRDASEGMRRLLIQGDLDALRAAAGSTGLEIDVDRRTRLLRQGILLEYTLGEDLVVRPHPWLERALGRRAP